MRGGNDMTDKTIASAMKSPRLLLRLLFDLFDGFWFHTRTTEWCPLNRFNVYRCLASILPALAGVAIFAAIIEKKSIAAGLGCVSLCLSLLLAGFIGRVGFAGSLTEQAKYWMCREDCRSILIRGMAAYLFCLGLWGAVVAAIPDESPSLLLGSGVFAGIFFSVEHRLNGYEGLRHDLFAHHATFSKPPYGSDEVRRFISYVANNYISEHRHVMPENVVQHLQERFKPQAAGNGPLSSVKASQPQLGSGSS
jgi:hypothetical protein